MNISPAAPWIDDDAAVSFRQMMDQEEQMKNLPLDFADDALAASWASYGVWKKRPSQRWVPFRDVMISPHDREMADATRRYYRDKVAMQSLRRGQVSEFNQDLYDICNGGVLRHKHMGMLYRLPYFYIEDTAREALKADTKHQPSNEHVIPGMLAEKQTWRLHRDRRIFRSRRRQEVMEYWFRDHRGHAVKWSLPFNSDLQSLVDSIFDRDGGYSQIRAFYRLVHDIRSDFYYWRLLMPEIVFDRGA